MIWGENPLFSETPIWCILLLGPFGFFLFPSACYCCRGGQRWGGGKADLRLEGPHQWSKRDRFIYFVRKYGWWKKFCTRWYSRYPIICMFVFTSQVVRDFFHQQYIKDRFLNRSATAAFKTCYFKQGSPPTTTTINSGSWNIFLYRHSTHPWIKNGWKAHLLLGR